MSDGDYDIGYDAGYVEGEQAGFQQAVSEFSARKAMTVEETTERMAKIILAALEDEAADLEIVTDDTYSVVGPIDINDLTRAVVRGMMEWGMENSK